MRLSRLYRSLLLLTAAFLILPACGEDSKSRNPDAASGNVDAPTTTHTIDADASDALPVWDDATQVDVLMAPDTLTLLDGGTPRDGSSAVDAPTHWDASAPVDAATPVDGSAPGDARTPDLAASDATPVNACNSLVNSAPVIQEEAQTGAPPVLTGGTIVEGIYHRTAVVTYGTTKGRYVKETVRLTKISDALYKMEFVSATAITNPPSPEYSVNVELTLTGGANVDYNIVCGTTGKTSTTYEANATTFRLRLGLDLVYTLQP